MWSKIQSNETPVKCVWSCDFGPVVVCCVDPLPKERSHNSARSPGLIDVFPWGSCVLISQVCQKLDWGLSTSFVLPVCRWSDNPDVKDNNGSEVQPILAGVSLDDVWTRTGRNKLANPVSLDLLKMLSVMSPMMTLKWTFAEASGSWSWIQIQA